MRLIRDAQRPFRTRVDRSSHLGHAHRHVITARVLMPDGRRVTLRRRLRFCGGEGS